MSFDSRKAETVAALALPSEEYEDKSPKGSVDVPVIPLLRLINSHADLFSTSSCSGRITLLARDSTVHKGGEWLLSTHDEANVDEAVRVLDEYVKSNPSEKMEVSLRFEPFLLSVETRTIEAAAAFLRVAVEAGCRDSGIMNVTRRFMVSVRCSLRMEVPLFFDGRLQVPLDSVRALVGVANEKFRKNLARIERFTQHLRQCMFAPKTQKFVVLVPPRDTNRIRQMLNQQGIFDRRRKIAIVEHNNERYAALPTVPIEGEVRGMPSEVLVLPLKQCDPWQGGHTRRSPRQQMQHSLLQLVPSCGSDSLEKALPKKWEMLQDIALLPPGSLQQVLRVLGESAPLSDSTTQEALCVIARAIPKCTRLAMQAPIDRSLKRHSRARVVLDLRSAGSVVVHPQISSLLSNDTGDLDVVLDGWVQHKENGIVFNLEVQKCMFCSGNGSEKERVATLARQAAEAGRPDVVADMFAGIGYFTLPYLVHGKVQSLTSFEWNDNALEALRRNLVSNNVKAEVVPGDNTVTCMREEFHDRYTRVNLGLIPTVNDAQLAASVHLLRHEGGILHVHGNVTRGEEEQFTQHVVQVVSETCESIPQKRALHIESRGLHKVKNYAPRIAHYVLDVALRTTE